MELTTTMEDKIIVETVEALLDALAHIRKSQKHIKIILELNINEDEEKRIKFGLSGKMLGEVTNKA